MLALFFIRSSGVRGLSQSRTRASSPEYAEQQRCQEDHDKDEEQDLRDFGCSTRDTAEAEKRRDDRDDEKDDSVSKHEALHRGRFSDWFACWLDAPPPCLPDCAAMPNVFYGDRTKSNPRAQRARYP